MLWYWVSESCRENKTPSFFTAPCILLIVELFLKWTRIFILYPAKFEFQSLSYRNVIPNYFKQVQSKWHVPYKWSVSGPSPI